jgi:hypothetical protein
MVDTVACGNIRLSSQLIRRYSWLAGYIRDHPRFTFCRLSLSVQVEVKKEGVMQISTQTLFMFFFTILLQNEYKCHENCIKGGFQNRLTLPQNLLPISLKWT